MKNIKYNFPIRYKFLLTMSLLLIITETIFIRLTSSQYFKSKYSEIYEGLLNSLSVSSSFIEREKINQDKFSKSITANYLLKKNKNHQYQLSVGNDFFNDSSDLMDILIYKKKNDKILKYQHIKNNEIQETYFHLKNLFAEDSILKKYIKKSSGKRFSSYSVFKKTALPYRANIFYDKKNRLFIVYRFIISKTIESIMSNFKFNTFVTDDEFNYIFLSGQTLSKKNFKKKYHQLFQRLKKDINKNGVKKVQIHEKEGSSQYIIAYKKVLNSNLILFSEIESEKAFILVNKIIFNTLKITILILLFFSFISFYFSKMITSPLEKLNEVVNQALKGDYSKRVIVNTRDEIYSLAKSFNKMLEKVNHSINELQYNNKNLEKIVFHKTKDLEESVETLKLMINGLEKSIFIFDKNGDINPTHSDTCNKDFGLDISEKNISEIIRVNDEDKFKKWVGLLFEEVVSFEETIKMGPQFFTIPNSPNAKDIKFTFNYYPLRDKKKQIKSIMAIMEKY